MTLHQAEWKVANSEAMKREQAHKLMIQMYMRASGPNPITASIPEVQGPLQQSKSQTTIPYFWAIAANWQLCSSSSRSLS